MGDLNDELRPLTGRARRKEFITLDIESKDGVSQRAGFTRPFMVGIFNGESFEYFTDLNYGGDPMERYWREGGCVARAMLAVLSDRYAGKLIYAHNAGRFDYLFMLPWLMDQGERLGFRFRIIPVASSIQVLDVWHVTSGNRWRFVDSYKLIPIGLDKAAKTFGLEGKVKHDLNLHESNPHWKVYLEGDCVQLYRVLEKFHGYIENTLQGEVGITAPSTSMKLYRRRFLKRAIPRSRATHPFIRESYVGGRVEVFEERGTKLRYFDINSSYPRAMLEAMPAGEAQWWKGKPPKRLREHMIGFVRANVYVPPHLHIPPLPIRGKKEYGLPEGKLLFPAGKLHGVWEWSELQMALEVGCRIEEWFESVWYGAAYLFEDFVNELYKYRDKNHPEYDEGLAQVVKIMLNSLYGKFGMRTLRKKVYRFDDPDLPPNAVPASCEPESLIWYAEEECDAPYIMPQISARITSLARQRLYRAMRTAELLGGRVYYCDTDSVVTDVVLPTSSKLGDLKDEFPAWSGNIEGWFIGPKLYLLSAEGPEPLEKVKAKGLEKRTRENLVKLATGQSIVQKRLEKVGTLARDGFTRGPRLITVPRKIQPDAGKREKLSNGHTRPFVVEMY